LFIFFEIQQIWGFENDEVELPDFCSLDMLQSCSIFSNKKSVQVPDFPTLEMCDDLRR